MNYQDVGDIVLFAKDNEPGSKRPTYSGKVTLTDGTILHLSLWPSKKDPKNLYGKVQKKDGESTNEQAASYEPPIPF